MAMAPEVAGRQLAAYRQRHTIFPVVGNDEMATGGRGVVCAHDGIRVYRIRGGWRHNPDVIRELVEAAPVRWPL